jgi:lysophospholipase L1-like esterase
MSHLLKPNQKLLFIGDSITDCGRGRPLGKRGQLGLGYVSFVDSLLGAILPEVPICVLNAGTSGNRVIDLEQRWQSDVLDLKPNWLSVMIGINDVWRQFDGAPGEPQVDPDQYESIYRRLLSQTLPKLDGGLILITPYYLETNKEDPMRKLMDVYGSITKKLAQEFGAVLVDAQAAFDQYLTVSPTQSLCSDRVHPNGVGHMIIARAFIQAMGVR